MNFTLPFHLSFQEKKTYQGFRIFNCSHVKIRLLTLLGLVRCGGLLYGASVQWGKNKPTIYMQNI